MACLVLYLLAFGLWNRNVWVNKNNALCTPNRKHPKPKTPRETSQKIQVKSECLTILFLPKKYKDFKGHQVPVILAHNKKKTPLQSSPVQWPLTCALEKEWSAFLHRCAKLNSCDWLFSSCQTPEQRRFFRPLPCAERRVVEHLDPPRSGLCGE